MIRKLDWDSDFFGINIANLEIDDSVKELYFLDKFIRLNDIDIIQTRCNVSETKTINMLENNGFAFVDLRMNYILYLNNAKKNKTKYLIANKDDIPFIKNVSNNLFTNTRYCHERFDREKVNKFYEIWLEKSVVGQFDDICLKVLENNTVAGFASVVFIDEKVAKIGLIGVGKDYQNKCIGRRLINSLFNFLFDRDIKIVKVVTQGRNILAQNFYIKNGFQIESIEAWYYKIINKKIT